jgi:hypothetical protein
MEPALRPFTAAIFVVAPAAPAAPAFAIIVIVAPVIPVAITSAAAPIVVAIPVSTTRAPVVVSVATAAARPPAFVADRAAGIRRAITTVAAAARPIAIPPFNDRGLRDRLRLRDRHRLRNPRWLGWREDGRLHWVPLDLRIRAMPHARRNAYI